MFGLYNWVQLLTGGDITKQDHVLKVGVYDALTQIAYTQKKNEIEEQEMNKST